MSRLELGGLNSATPEERDKIFRVGRHRPAIRKRTAVLGTINLTERSTDVGRRADVRGGIHYNQYIDYKDTFFYAQRPHQRLATRLPARHADRVLAAKTA